MIFIQIRSAEWREKSRSARFKKAQKKVMETIFLKKHIRTVRNRNRRESAKYDAKMAKKMFQP